MLDEMHMLLGEIWAYDPHSVISNRRIENGYSTFIHESRPDLEKIASRGVISLAGSNIQTPIISEKSNKRSKETMIDLDDEEQGANKRKIFTEEFTFNPPSFYLHLGEEKNVPASPRSHEISPEQVPLIKQMFT